MYFVKFWKVTGNSVFHYNIELPGGSQSVRREVHKTKTKRE